MIDQSLELRGAHLRYRVSGRGEPLVLVHANLSDMRSWEPLEPLLAKHFHVVTYSRRFAKPNAPIEPGADDPLDVHVEDLLALVGTLQLGKVHLVGNSSGAFICLLAAQKRPELVRTLTLEEPPVVSMILRRLPPQPPEVLARLFTDPAGLLALMRFGAGTIGPATRAFREGRDADGLDIFGRGVLGAEAFALLSASRRRQMIDNVAPHRAALLGRGLPIFTAIDARAIVTPTQLLRGSETPAFQRRINQRLARLIPGARDVCVQGASHFVHEDNPRAVLEAVVDFCRSPTG